MTDSNYRFLPIEEVIAEIGIDTDNEDSRDSIVYKQWIYRGLRQLGYVKANIKMEIVDVCDFAFPIPCDLAELIYINLLSSSGDPVLSHWHTTGGFTGENGCNISLAEQETEYALSTNATGVSRAEIKYWAYPVDDKQQPLIPEIFLEAIIAWVDFKWWNRERKRKPREVNRFDIQQAKQQWIETSNAARSQAKKPNMMEAERIGRSTLSRLNYMGRIPLAFNRRSR